jgi:transcription elongation factor SPT6
MVFLTILVCLIGAQSLDAEDLELLEENTGTRMDRQRSKHLSRIRRGRASESASPPPRGSGRSFPGALSEDEESNADADLSHIFDDRRRGDDAGLDDMDADDFDDGFIDDDDDEDLDRDMGEEERLQRRKDKRRREREQRSAMKARPELAGIDPAAWDEIFDVFGLGTEYDWALDHEDEPSDTEQAPKEMRYQDVRSDSRFLHSFAES